MQRIVFHRLKKNIEGQVDTNGFFCWLWEGGGGWITANPKEAVFIGLKTFSAEYWGWCHNETDLP